MSKTPSRLVAALIATSVVLSVAAPAEARVGSGRSSSAGASRSSSSSYAVAPSSSRVGSGGASGMQRPEVMNRVRGQDAQPAQAGGYAAPAAGAAAAPAGAAAGAPARSGSSWVAPALAGAAVGAAAGYVASEAMRPNAPAGGGNYNNGGVSGGGAPMEPAAASAAAPAAGYGAMPGQQSSGGGMWLWLLVGLLGAGAFYMWKRNQARPAAAVPGAYSAGGSNAYRTAAPAAGAVGYGPDADELQRVAPAFFKTMQDLNNSGDVEGLRKYTTPMMFEQLRVDLDGRGGPADTQVVDMRAEVVDFTRNGDGAQVASLRFRGHVSEAGAPAETVDEVWHLLREQGDGWRLAGIEQV
ncbi:Tim44 domain-containing protein [Derxia lacustris]|uniref:hypothetical protein n=1 Tax=Derxia lacustris TaxID=764842 RepID=UPI001592E495|nr:hypothetical protein [Derxia lacustris]